ncbi:hypothetical protein LSUB1_G005850 [Lachnellula subtilissima]|uniref:F-box domain-containing protein n=1 Tax=Lachnellula subtilissima TaxID=602034 RepID=A0A8H8UA15_9HELO|nr:hypothetical protein LSUB1_G005850 [Lachnellula subtilissima]
MGVWRRLPAEIRSMILEMVAEDYRFKSEQYARAGYASVCREWQAVFEQRNFQRLVLNQERISDLERVMGTKQRREYLGHLFLRVRLNHYDCAVCKSKEDNETIRNSLDFVSYPIEVDRIRRESSPARADIGTWRLFPERL